MLADMWTNIEVARLLVHRAAATSIDGKYPAPLDGTIAKYFANEVLSSVVRSAVQICAGDGVALTHPVQRIYRDSAICMIAGGTPQIARNVIAGMIFPDRKFPQTRN